MRAANADSAAQKLSDLISRASEIFEKKNLPVETANCLGDWCAAMRRKWIRRCVCITVSLVCILCLILWTNAAYTIRHYLDCSDYYSEVYLEELVRIPRVEHNTWIALYLA